MPTDQLNRVNWDLLYLPFTERVFELVANCNTRGFRYFANIGYRTPEEQLALWQKGRNQVGAVINPKAVVTKVKFSPHNLGIAVDFVLDGKPDTPQLDPDWNTEHYRVLAEEAVKLKLESGFYWKGLVDADHVQLPMPARSLTSDQLRRTYWVKGQAGVFEALDKVGPWF